MYNDPEEIPISGPKKTFEEMLEEKIQEDFFQPVQKREVPKREFLRRKSNPPGEYRVSKYEEFEEKPVKVQDRRAQEPPQRLEDKPIIPKMKKPSPSVQIEPAAKTPEPSNKKQFLKRGEGKSCLTKKESKPKQTKSKKNLEPYRAYDDTPITIKESKPKQKPVQYIPEDSPPKKPVLPPPKPKTEDTIYYDPSALAYDESEPIIKPSKSNQSKQQKDYKETKEFKEVKEVKELKKVVEVKEAKSKAEEIYNEKMNELNAQIERFKQQASLIKTENKDIKQKISQIDQEFSEFSSRKEKRIAELQNLKSSELKRMKKERMELEKSLKVPEPKSNSEAEDLRSQLFKTQEEFSIKDFKDKENLDKLSEELSKLNTEINDLEAQVRIREQLILKEKFSKPNPNPKQPSEKVYSNGTRVKQYPDGKKVIQFTNGDIKETHPDGKVIYIYNEDQTTEITLPDGTTICEFSNGQTEKTFPDGTKEVTFPDGSSQTLHN